MLHDPRARRAYVLTKLGFFVAATVMTWPLSRLIGTKAWWGLGVLGAVMLLITVGVLAASRGAGQAGENGEGDGSEPEPDVDPVAHVVLPVEDSIDLHPFAPHDVPQVVADYLEEAHRRGFREVRLIHGRGIGVQRDAVRKVLEGNRYVEAYHDAPASRGGWGATVAYLKPTGGGTD